jgi:hypothetical protein
MFLNLRSARSLATSAFILIVVCMQGAVACKAKLGGSCKPGKDACEDSATALHCAPDNTYVEVKCAGSLGCTKLGAKVYCDNSTAEVADACMGESEGEYACSSTKKRAVVCSSGKFKPYLECRGPKGCTMMSKTVSCDNTIAERGDPCISAGKLACSTDAKNRFVCKDGKWEVERYCRGRDACQVRMNDWFCDTSLADANDPCGVAGAVACSTDGSHRLVCKGGRMAEDIACKKGCTVAADHKVDCR